MKLNPQNAGLGITAGLPTQFPCDNRPQIVFSGRSNVGKSSLINTLLGRKSLARVSSAPGKTITVNFYEIDKKLYLVDLPGYGYAKRSEAERRIWAGLTDGYFTRYIDRVPFLSVLQLIDLKTGPTRDDEMMFDWMEGNGIPYFVAATKCDKLNKTDRAEAEQELRTYLGEDRLVIPFSSLTGEGREELRSHLCELYRTKGM